MEIAAAILIAILEEERLVQGEPRKTRLQAHAYLNWKALNVHLEKLRTRDLVERDNLHITERGQRFLQAYSREFAPLIEKFGFGREG